MKIECEVKQIIEDGDELSISLRGWWSSDPDGTYLHPVGEIKIPSTAANRKAYYIGRRLFVEIKPARS